MVYVLRFVCGYYTLLLLHLPRTKNTERQFKSALELVERIEKTFDIKFLLSATLYFVMLGLRLYWKRLYHQFTLSEHLLRYNFDSWSNRKETLKYSIPS